MSGEMFCALEALENGSVVRFHRAMKQKRQIPPDRPDMVRMVRAGANALGRAMREGEDWRGAAEEAEQAAGSEGPKVAQLQEVWTLEAAAKFCSTDAETVTAIQEARKAWKEARELGLSGSTAYAHAVPAGIGLSQAFYPHQ